jgi:predicted NAD/FAD-dependent oxidoreductase
MLSAFARLCPSELPPISYCRSHRWRHALPQRPLELPFCYDDDLKLGVAGDWCSAGNVDSAYWSGADLGTAVIRSLKIRPKRPLADSF